MIFVVIKLSLSQQKAYRSGSLAPSPPCPLWKLSKLLLKFLEFRPPDPTGPCRRDAGKSPYPAGKHRKSLARGSSIPAGNSPDFFQWFSAGSCQKAQEVGRNPPEKILKISGRNTASKKSPESSRIGRFRAELLDLGVVNFGNKRRI